jgi:hypothetical protein
MQVNERTPEERCSEFSLAADPRTYFLIDAVTGQMSGNATYQDLAARPDDKFRVADQWRPKLKDPGSRQ